MAAYAVARVHAPPELRARLVAKLRTKLRCGGADEATLQQLVEDHANAVTIDLQQRRGIPHDRTLSAVLVCQLHWALGQQPELKDKDAWAELYLRITFIAPLVAEFCRQTGRNVFIHVDEVRGQGNTHPFACD